MHDYNEETRPCGHTDEEHRAMYGPAGDAIKIAAETIDGLFNEFKNRPFSAKSEIAFTKPSEPVYVKLTLTADDDGETLGEWDVQIEPSQAAVEMVVNLIGNVMLTDAMSKLVDIGLGEIFHA